MNTNEKLKKSSLEAEISLYEQIPDDSEIDWEPSKDFLKKMDSLFNDADKPRIKKSFFNKFSAIAAMLIIACVAVFLPVSHYFNESDDVNSYVPKGNVVVSDSQSDSDGKDHGYKTSSDDKQLGNSQEVTCGDIEKDDVSEDTALLPFSPEYIPEGYYLVKVKVENDNITTALEYSNGNDSFTFYSTTDTIDLNRYYNSYVVDYNSNSYYCNTLPTEDVEGTVNNIIWFYGSNSFMITANGDISAKELQKIATSFNLIPNE